MTNSNGHSGIESKGSVYLMKLKCEKPHLYFAVEPLEFLAVHELGPKLFATAVARLVCPDLLG